MNSSMSSWAVSSSIRDRVTFSEVVAGTSGGQPSPGETWDHRGEDPLFSQCLTRVPHRMPLGWYEELSGS